MRVKIIKIGNSRGIRLPKQMIERYGVYWISLDPVTGSEPAKTRPAVVISDNNMNRYLETTVICPITSRIHAHWPGRITTRLGGKEAEIAVDQIRTVPKKRIGKQIGKVDVTTAEQVRHIITVMYGVLSS